MTSLLELPAETYHADQVADGPTLSASTAAVLCSQSPMHAWAGHPRNPKYAAPEETPHFDIGTAAHSILLEGRDNVYVIHAENWRTKASKEERDYARTLGKVPLLAHHRDEVYAMLDAVEGQLDKHGATPRPFTEGKAERTILWEESNGVKCRARLDWLRDDFSHVDDFKTAAHAEPKKWTDRSIYDHGYDVRSAFHLRGIEKALNERPEWRWIVIEKKPPFGLIVVSPGQDVLALAEAKVTWAIDRWRECLAADSWPGYPTEVCYAELPAWEESRWMEKEGRDAA